MACRSGGAATCWHVRSLAIPSARLKALCSPLLRRLIGRAVATVITFPAQRANVMAKAGNDGGKGKGLIAMLVR
jgi:hypothetical protein